MASGLTIIKFYDLAAGHFLLSLNAPPPPDVPPANIQLKARTSYGSGLFYAVQLRGGGLSSSQVVILKQVLDDDEGIAMTVAQRLLKRPWHPLLG
jgi:hypothetical protein